MSKKFKIKQLGGIKTCEWHREKSDVEFESDKILPQGICPWLYHTVYPYFLGLLYGAKFSWNEKGDCNVCCPAGNGVDVIVQKRDNDGNFDPRISEDMSYVIFAEVVDVHGKCPYKHKKGDRFIFPTSMKEHYMCPAGFNNVFPFLDLKVPPCIDKKKLRCPDWDNVINFDVIRK